MFSLALILYFLFIAAYIAFAAVLWYHVHTYTIPEDPSHSFIFLFFAASFILISISAYLFSRVPWNIIN